MEFISITLAIICLALGALLWFLPKQSKIVKVRSIPEIQIKTVEVSRYKIETFQGEYELNSRDLDITWLRTLSEEERFNLILNEKILECVRLMSKKGMVEYFVQEDRMNPGLKKISFRIRVVNPKSFN